MEKRAGLLCAIALISASWAARAEPVKDAAGARAEVQKMFGFLPDFIKRIPDIALPSAWEEMKTLQMNPETALSGKAKELIGLAVASQVPCEYCVYAHTAFAKMNGATDVEIGEAVALAGLTRNFSTFVNGIQPDEVKFKAELAKVTDHVKKMMSGKVPPPKDIALVDAKSAAEDIKQTFGSMPEFLAKFPPEALAAVWRAEKDIEIKKTSLDEKTKSLI